MVKISVTDSFGEVHFYNGDNIKFSREGNAVDIFAYYAEGRDLRRHNLGAHINPATVKIETETVKSTEETKKRAPDEFTAKELEGKDTPEEAALLKQYTAIKEKTQKPKTGRKRRTKVELAKINKDERKKENTSLERPDPLE